MEPARPRTRRSTPRRGTVARPVNTRLLRNASVLVVAPVLLLLVTAITPGSLPPPALPPAFDAGSALRLTRELAHDYPNRVPGTSGADRAARWYRDRLALYGLLAAEDRWQADVPGLGPTGLTNLVTVVPGASEEVVLVVAHRDNEGGAAGANDNASGTAALVELLRPYARTAERRRLKPHHTLVFLSSDGGAYGALGAGRFARTSPLAGRVVAALSLDGLAGRARPRLEIASAGPHTSPPALYGTIAARVREQTGAAAARAGWLTQIVDLALPLGYGEQAQFLAAERPSIRLTTAPNAGSAGDDAADLDPQTLGQLGRAAETTLGSLDEAIRLSARPAGFLYVGDRVLRGWAFRLALVMAVLPFAAVALDLLARALRKGVRLRPHWHRLRRRLGFWLAVAGLVFVAALAGALPIGGPDPPPADAEPLDRWPALATIVVAALSSALWLRLRRSERGGTEPDHAFGGYVVSFTALLVVAAALAVVNTYALVFLLPSLYAWLWLPQLRARSGWLTDVTYGIGLTGPVVAVVVLGQQLDLGVRAPLYLAGLATSGTVPWLASVCVVAWAAVAGEVAQLTAAAPPSQQSGV